MADNKYLEAKAKIEKAIDQICKDGYKNLFLVGVGGTLCDAWQIDSILKPRTTIPYFVEHGAEFNTMGNKNFGKDSVVIIESASGDTKEIVEAVEKAHAVGARVIGLVEKADSPLAKAVDYLFDDKAESFYKWYVIVMRFMKNNGEFPEYDRFFKEIETLPALMEDLSKNNPFEAQGKAWAEKYCDWPINYLCASGNLWGSTYSLGMCLMEEMLWMRTKAIDAGNFFHGTLEIIDRDSSIMLFIGEDETRPMMERVLKFVTTICNNVAVWDTKDIELPGISPEFRGLISPFLFWILTGPVISNLEKARRHPMAIRRYYRKLDY